MIDHFNLPVSNLDRSKIFYAEILKTLGYRIVLQDGDAFGFGIDTWSFDIVLIPQPFPQLHLAFKAISSQQVHQFYEAAINAGAKSNGTPGLRPDYGPGYYAAYVLDFDNHNIEAKCRGIT